MPNLFKKTAVMTDLHVGLKNNSIQHNEDCLEFVRWFTETAKKESCDIAIICGDWHNNRAQINVHTLHYSLMCIELLNNSFDQVYFITGNHDLYYRDKRDVHSISWAKYLPNIKIINDIYTEGDVTFCPWLVGDEVNNVKKIKSKYTFGHFELGSFYMNSRVLMPDHKDGIKIEDFSNTEQVFSGHFHKRQYKNNITYIGNCFPHNYSDAGDDERGMMILEWDKSPQFFSWPNQPKYRIHNLSSILDRPDELLLPDSHVRVNLDIDVSYEESAFIKEQLFPKYKLREMTLIPIKSDLSQDDTDYTNLHFESVDSIIQAQIGQLQDGSFDKQLLLEIYRTL